MDQAEGSPRPVRVLIVEDHQVVADGLELALSRDPEIEVVGIALTGADGKRLAREANPNVVLLDYFLPDCKGDAVARAIRNDCPACAVVVLTADGNDEVALACVAAGVSGFLVKAQAARQVVTAVRRAAEGEMLIPAAMLAAILGPRSQPGLRAGKSACAEELTVREREVLIMMADGLDNRAIADRLAISYATVRSHVQNILGKLDAHSKLEALARASDQGLMRRP